jgi:hypothetical protein
MATRDEMVLRLRSGIAEGVARRLCGKRLRATLPVLLEAMERHGHLQLAPEVSARPGQSRTKLVF